MDARTVARRPIRFALVPGIPVGVAGSATAAAESRAAQPWIPGDGAGQLDRAAHVARALLSDGHPLAGADAGDAAGRRDLAAAVARAGRAAGARDAPPGRALPATRRRSPVR